MQEQIATLSSIDNRDQSWLDKLSTRNVLLLLSLKNLSLPEATISPDLSKGQKLDSVAGDPNEIMKEPYKEYQCLSRHGRDLLN